jgi:hypothetical protein
MHSDGTGAMQFLLMLKCGFVFIDVDIYGRNFLSCIRLHLIATSRAEVLLQTRLKMASRNTDTVLKNDVIP